MGIFSDIANTKIGDVEPPKLIPIGHYQAQFVGQFKEHKSQQKGTPAAQFPMRLIAPGEDVDHAALEQAGGLPDKTFPYNFWMTADSMFRFTDFAKAQGVSESANLMEALEEVGTSGKPFLIEVKHDPIQGQEGKFRLNFDNPAPLD